MGTCLATLEKKLALGSIDSYIEWAYKIPLLSATEEHDLAHELQTTNSIEAAKKLILHNLRFVIHIARGYHGYGLPLADLIQEGNIGLMKAIKKFNPKEGVRLISYAVHWIKAEIHEYVIQNIKSATKIATKKSERKLFFNLRKEKARRTHQRSLTQAQAQDIAEQLNVPVEDVITMEKRLEPHDVSLEAPLQTAENASFSHEAYLADNSCNQALLLEQDDWEQQRLRQLQHALENIEPRERTIIENRYLKTEKITLQALAKQLGISTERVRQLEKKALSTLGNLLTSDPEMA